jgi:GNAT superfamily N-acetyltransferase
MTTVTIAKLTPADHGDWRKLWLEWQHYLSGILSEETNARAWSLLTKDGSGLFGLIARQDGEALGIAHASITPFAWAGGPIIYLQDLFVTKQIRGQGVGHALLSAVYDLADDMGAAQVFWLADQNDTALQRFYDRHALRTPYNRFMRHRWPWFAAEHH